MQRLVIRLGSTNHDPIHWLVYSDDEKEIIASGRLNDESELSSLNEHSENSHVTCLAPASSLYLTNVTLPANASRKALSAIPFMVEEELCSDISKMFFAQGKKLGDNIQIAAIEKEKLKAWSNALSEAGIFCNVLIPDSLCLPESDSINVLALENEILAKFPDNQCIQGESEWVLPLVMNIADEKELRFACLSEIPQWSDTEKTDFNFDNLPMKLLLDGAQSIPLNLFQGEFAVKRKANPTWDKWKIAASLAIVALCVNLILKTSELNELKAERAEIRQQMQVKIKEGFPELNRVANIRRVLSREITKLEQGGGNLSMLAMLSRLGGAFESSGVKPQTIKYDSRRSEIRIQSVAQNFEALETFRRDAQSLGFEVEQGAINNRGSEVVGLITVRG